MRYYKLIKGDYIIAIGTGDGNTKITADEYAEIMTVIQNRPHAEGKGYKLKTDLTWEEYDLPEPTDEDEISDSEALAIILGGAE